MRFFSLFCLYNGEEIWHLQGVTYILELPFIPLFYLCLRVVAWVPLPGPQAQTFCLSLIHSIDDPLMPAAVLARQAMAAHTTNARAQD